MVSGPNIAAGIAGLISLTGRLVILGCSLRGMLRRCHALLRGISTLQNVLIGVTTEYENTLRLINSRALGSSELDLTNGLLSKNLSECRYTCEDFEKVLRAIPKSKLRAIMGYVEDSTVKELGHRLEMNKTTLVLLLASITEERERFQAVPQIIATTETSPPPYTAIPTTPNPSFGLDNSGLAMAGGGTLAFAASLALCLNSVTGWFGVGGLLVSGIIAAAGGDILTEKNQQEA